jgi:hypothetical protein
MKMLLSLRPTFFLTCMTGIVEESAAIVKGAGVPYFRGSVRLRIWQEGFDTL